VSDRRGKPSIWKVPRLGGRARARGGGGHSSRHLAGRAPHRVLARERRRPLSGGGGAPGRSGPGCRGSRVATRVSTTRSRRPGRRRPRDLLLGLAQHLAGGQRRLAARNASPPTTRWIPSRRGRPTAATWSSPRSGKGRTPSGAWPWAGGRPERITFGTGPEGHASISADGARLVYSTHSDDFDVVVVDRASARSERIGSQLYDASPSFAPDGTSVVFTSSRRGGQYDLWIQPLAGGRRGGRPAAAHRPLRHREHGCVLARWKVGRVQEGAAGRTRDLGGARVRRTPAASERRSRA
jgi:hypothetical protein